MTLVSVILALSVSAGQSAQEYFPLKPGTTWNYVEEGAAQTLSYVDVVLEPVEIDGGPAIPIESRVGGKVDQTRYYRVSENAVFLVAYDPKKPLRSPQPVFKMGRGRESWEYKGLTPFLGDDVPLEFKASTSPKGTRQVLGARRECVELVMEAKLLGGPDMVLEFRQTALYAKGVGLVEMKQKQTTKGKSTESTIRLTEFEIGS